jgi:hypothetical protein
VTDGGDPKPTDALAGELWTVKKDRIRRSSVHGKLPGWDLRSVSHPLHNDSAIVLFTWLNIIE